MIRIRTKSAKGTCQRGLIEFFSVIDSLQDIIHQIKVVIGTTHFYESSTSSFPSINNVHYKKKLINFFYNFSWFFMSDMRERKWGLFVESIVE